MNLSLRGLALLEEREGTRAQMYRDSAGLPTIGVGHLLTRDELYSGKLHLGAETVDWHAHEGLGDTQIDALLRQDLGRVEAALNSWAVVRVPLTQQQFDTLASFAFNVGVAAFEHSTLLSSLNEEKYNAVPTELRRWVYSAGRVDPGLVKRRESEVAQWEGLT